jgi:ABC-type glycerol-3-phosphate transport system permease component
LKNWFKKNKERIMNTTCKIAGILYLISFILYVVGNYQLSRFSTGLNMLILGLIFITMVYTPNNKIKGENNEQTN